MPSSDPPGSLQALPRVQSRARRGARPRGPRSQSSILRARSCSGSTRPGPSAPTERVRFVPAEERDATRHVFQRVIAGDMQAFGTHENDVVTAGGVRRTLVWRNAVLRGPDGTVTAGISTGVDITFRRELEARLAASEAEHRMVATTLDWEAWHAPDGSLAYCSRPACASPATPPRRSSPNPRLLVAIAHPDDAAAVAGHLDAVRSLAQACGIDFRIRTPKGEERWLNHVCQGGGGPGGALPGPPREQPGRDRTDAGHAAVPGALRAHDRGVRGPRDPPRRSRPPRRLPVPPGQCGLRAAHRARGPGGGGAPGPRGHPRPGARVHRALRAGGTHRRAGELRAAVRAARTCIHGERLPARAGTVRVHLHDVTEQRATLDALESALRRAEASEQSLPGSSPPTPATSSGPTTCRRGASRT